MATPGVAMAPAPKPPTRTLTVPGAGRVVTRRSAKDPSSGLTAYLVKENSGGAACNVSVALKRKDRYIGTVLKGHTAAVVDMEFLPTPPNSLIFTLGTCDQDGVVFLWFLRLTKDSLGIDYAIKQLRKYSFYSLRKSETAFYNRIRLAGTPQDGTMVLVPNDGSSVRVISFSCEPLNEPEAPAMIAAPEPAPQIEPPPAQSETVVPSPPSENKAAEDQIPTPQPISQEDFIRETEAEHAAGEDEAPRDPLNSTFPITRRPGDEPLVDDDITEAAARSAGITDPEAVRSFRSDAAVDSLEDGGAPRPSTAIFEGEGVYEEKEYAEYNIADAPVNK